MTQVRSKVRSKDRSKVRSYDHVWKYEDIRTIKKERKQL